MVIISLKNAFFYRGYIFAKQLNSITLSTYISTTIALNYLILYIINLYT
jgi:hypothetical protein